MSNNFAICFSFFLSRPTRLQEMINTRQTDRQNLQQMERRMGEERRQKQSLEAQLNNERKHRKQAEEKATRYGRCAAPNEIYEFPINFCNWSCTGLTVVMNRVKCADKCWKTRANNYGANWLRWTNWKNPLNNKREIMNKRWVTGSFYILTFSGVWQKKRETRTNNTNQASCIFECDSMQCLRKTSWALFHQYQCVDTLWMAESLLRLILIAKKDKTQKSLSEPLDDKYGCMATVFGRFN